MLTVHVSMLKGISLSPSQATQSSCHSGYEQPRYHVITKDMHTQHMRISNVNETKNDSLSKFLGQAALSARYVFLFAFLHGC